MNKSAIKKFAIEARKKLMASVSDRAGMLGITEKDFQKESAVKGADFEIYKTAAGTEVTLNRNQCEQRRLLVAQMEERGFEAVVEEVAYTWFNRICAIRFMEINDYLPTRVRVLSSEKEGKNEPDIVTQAPAVDLNFTDKEKEYIFEAKMDNKLDDLFKMLFIKQCNKLHEILPELFEETEDYTEMLLSISFTNKDDIIYMLVNGEDGIPEADFNVTTADESGEVSGQVEIIGWLYQYYNTELKDDTFSKLKNNIKITKERIPAATQLFTPDWIVRYMVENSIGRLWIEHLKSLDPFVDEKATAERFGWKYYLLEAEQDTEVNIKLIEIRTSYKELRPIDIKCIDPCMGSGHILIAMFDVLMDIYRSEGYSERDATFYIVENNIHGIDIDRRAYQLAYFAVMMKGRGYNRRFFQGRNDLKPVPNVHAILESNDIKREHLKYFGTSLDNFERNLAIQQIEYLIDLFRDAREYGSILCIKSLNWGILMKFAEDLVVAGQISLDSVGSDRTQKLIKKIIICAEMLEDQYDAVITNPPYMGNNGMSNKLGDYVKCNYPKSKSDMSTVCMEKANQLANKNGFIAMINIPVWMFLSTYEKLRADIIAKTTVVNMVHFGRGVFGSDFGTTSFVINNSYINGYVGHYRRLFKKQGAVDSVEQKKEWFFNEMGKYHICQNDFLKIPSSPIVYWITENVLKAFETKSFLSNVATPRTGIMTGKNEKFLRLWWEVERCKVNFSAKDSENAVNSGAKWFPYNKGGEYRKWYGNNDYVINWENGGVEVFGMAKSEGRNSQDYPDMYKFQPAISWSLVTSGKPAFRYKINNLSDIAGPSLYAKGDSIYYYLAFCNSVVALELLNMLNPTINYQAGNIGQLPILYDDNEVSNIICLAKENVTISKEDWNEREISWEYCSHPLICNVKKLSEAYDSWKSKCMRRFNIMKKNEEVINQYFIRLYGLEDDLDYNVSDNDVSVRIPLKANAIKELISFAVGCMFGRYSVINKDYIVDKNNIIPITDEEYFQDDIVAKFVEFVKCVYGSDYLEENLDYIAKALGEQKGYSSREYIRMYFLNDFMNDHCIMCSTATSGKRPYYWQFDSGKENAFKALIYIHRYDRDLVGKIRIDYLHRIQIKINKALEMAEYIVENANSPTEKANATKLITKYTKQLAEIKNYDEAIAHVANLRIEVQTDDGIKTNYSKFQSIEVSTEGKKSKRINLLKGI